MKKKTVLASLLGFCTLAACAGYDVPQGTVLYYPFDTAATARTSFGSAQAPLAQGQGNVAFSAEGRSGGCLYFDGDDTLTLEQLPAGMPLGASPYTVAAWVRADRSKAFATSAGWIGYGVRGAHGEGNSFRHNGEDGVQNYWNWRDLNVETPGLADGGWHQIVGTWDGEVRKVYFDGKLVGSDRQLPEIKWAPLVIGATINDKPYTGWIDDVLVANRAFAADEIATLHKTGVKATGVASDKAHDGYLLAGDEFLSRADLDKAQSREFDVTGKWLLLPVKNGGRMCKARVFTGDTLFHEFDIEIAQGEADWVARLDVSSLKGGKIKVTVEGGRAGAKALANVKVSDDAPTPDGYDGAFRPQFHFSANRGWINDPNGLSFYNGEWHVFFQHNPYGVAWGNMHWGHAVSKDLFHWREVGEAIYPDALGAMFSGSAVVDKDNTAGFGKNAHVLTFTGTANGSTQGIAYSTDGRTYTKYAGNPVVANIMDGNRDPRVFWYAPGKHWVLTLWVGEEGYHNVAVFNSPDLKSWQRVGTIRGSRMNEGAYLFECPELFELKVEGEATSRWVVWGANSEYSIGTFDGKNFTPEAERLVLARPIHGDVYYATQTFGDVPDGRRIWLPWFRLHTPGMPFTHAMGLPCELKIVRTAKGLRLAGFPVKEVETLRKGAAVPWKDFKGELVEAFIDQKIAATAIVRYSVRGIPLAYNAAQETLTIGGVPTSWPLVNGRFQARLFIDRAGLEVYSSDGLICVPDNSRNADPNDQTLKITEGAHRVLDDKSCAYELSGTW